MIKNKKNEFFKWYTLIIIVTIMFFITTSLYFNLKKDNNKIEKETKNTEKSDNYEKANYQYEGTYRGIVYHSILSTGEENTKQWNDNYFVVIRGNNNSIDLYRCTEENGCKKNEGSITCNNDYTICTKNINNDIENSTYTYKFSNEQLEIKMIANYSDNSSIEYTETSKWYNNSIEIKEYSPSKEEFKPSIPQIGMDKSEVKSIWGEPEKKNIHTYTWGIVEQWRYSNNRYVYFDNNIVTSITTQE